MYNISDYKLAEYIIKACCKRINEDFVDLEIEFDENGINDIRKNKIYLFDQKSLTQVIYNIVKEYLENFEELHGSRLFKNNDQKLNILLLISNYLRSLSYNSKCDLSSLPDTPVCQRLYQYPLVWNILKNIIVPVYNVPCDNMKVVIFHSPYVDASYYYENEVDDFIFSNLDVLYEPVRHAFILYAALEAFDLCPVKTGEKIFSTVLRHKIEGAAKLYFEQDYEVEDFMIILSSLLGQENKISNSIFIDIFDNKVAQSLSNPSQITDGVGYNWWFLGLLEKLIEPARGSDWSTYKNLEPLHKELWDKIEKERQKAGRKGLNYEALLRIQSGEVKPDKVKLIEDNLSSDRIW